MAAHCTIFFWFSLLPPWEFIIIPFGKRGEATFRLNVPHFSRDAGSYESQVVETLSLFVAFYLGYDES